MNEILWIYGSTILKTTIGMHCWKVAEQDILVREGGKGEGGREGGRREGGRDTFKSGHPV